MVDFKALLAKPVGTVQAPKVLPAGVYPGVITKYEFGDRNKNKTPYLRLHMALTGWPENVSPDETLDGDGEAIDLAKRGNFRRDFYLTDEALHIAYRFIKEVLPDSVGQEAFDMVPQLVGATIQVEIRQYTSAASGELGNDVGQLSAA